MNRRAISAILLGLGVVGLIGLTRVTGPENRPTSAPARIETASHPARPEPSRPIRAATVATTPQPHPRIDPALRDLLDRLRETFEPDGSKPNRFRLQRRLGTLWGDAPPVEILLAEAGDPAAPPDYRDHFAARLRNLGKTSSAAEREELARTLRETLATRPAGSAALARALLAFDDQPASIRAVSGQLDAFPDEDTTAGLFAALALSDSTESRDALWEHTRRRSTEPDRFARALQTSLPPLSLEPGLDVEPVLGRVLATTSRFPLYETAVRSCFARPPGPASLAALRVAVARRTEFSSGQQERLEHLLRAGLLRWDSQATASSTTARNGIETLLQQLP